MPRKKLTKKQMALKERIREEVSYIDEDLQVHFSFPDKDHFHIDVIEDGASHFHIHGEFWNGNEFEVRSISNQMTQYNSQNMMNLVTDLIGEEF